MKKLYITKDTEWGEIYDFVKNRIENPIKVGDSRIYSFNNHKVNKDELPTLCDDIYIIPYGMTTVWSEMMVTVMPLRLRYSKMLRYDVENNEYNVADRFSSHLDKGYIRSLRGELEGKL